MHKNILNATQQQKSATFKSNAGNKSNVSRCTIKTKTKATRKQTIQKYFQEPFEYWSWYYWILVNECDFLISREPSSLLKRSSPIIFQKGNFFKATQDSFSKNELKYKTHSFQRASARGAKTDQETCECFWSKIKRWVSRIFYLKDDLLKARINLQRRQ